MSTGSIIGIINAIILVCVILGGIVKSTKLIPKSLKPAVNNIHKFAGFYLCIAPLVHAYFMLGGLRFHPGFVLYFMIWIQVALILLAKKFKKKALFTAHKIFPVLILLVLAGHIFLQ